MMLVLVRHLQWISFGSFFPGSGDVFVVMPISHGKFGSFEKGTKEFWR